MAGSSGGGGSGGGSGGSVNKVALLLLGGGLLAILSIFNPPPPFDGGDDDDPEPPPVENVEPKNEAPPPAQPPANPPANPAGQIRPADDDLRGGPENAILTITAYGMPARISARTEDPNASLRVRVRDLCTPDVQFPNPCVTDYVAKRGTVLIIEAGSSLAGFWPVLESVTGAGCNLKESGRDQTCRVQLDNDATVEARYYGDTTPDGKYSFPKCPANRGNSPQPWMSRC